MYKSKCPEKLINSFGTSLSHAWTGEPGVQQERALPPIFHKIVCEVPFSAYMVDLFCIEGAPSKHESPDF